MAKVPKSDEKVTYAAALTCDEFKQLAQECAAAANRREPFSAKCIQRAKLRLVAAGQGRPIFKTVRAGVCGVSGWSTERCLFALRCCLHLLPHKKRAAVCNTTNTRCC